jgi:hypothetical protein
MELVTKAAANGKGNGRGRLGFETANDKWRGDFDLQHEYAAHE